MLERKLLKEIVILQYGSINLLNKDLMLIVVGRILQILITLISIRVLTSILTVEEVGNYYVLLSIVAFFNLVFMNPVETYMNRHLIPWQESKNLLNSLFVFLLWVVLISLISLPISSFIYWKFNYVDKFSLIIFSSFIFISIIVSSLYRKIIFGLNTLGYKVVFMTSLILTLIIRLILAILITKYYYNFALGWLFGYISAEFFMLYYLFNKFREDNNLNIKSINLKLTKARVQKILSFSLPVGITTFLLWGQNTSYQLIIDYKYSAEILGMIVIGLAVPSTVFNTLQSIAMQHFNPIFFKNINNATKDERAKAWNDIAKQVVPVYVVAIFFTISLSEILISLLVDRKFHDSYIYSMIGVGIEFFKVMTNLLLNISQSEHKTNYTIKPYLVGFSFSFIILMLIDFQDFNFMIPVTLVVSYFIIYIYMYINMKKLLEIKYDINLIKILLLSIPFLFLFFINISNASSIFNLLILGVSGLYFIGIILLILKKTTRLSNTT
jgi:O-antigen/teichoic acid export membrane protein